MAKKLPLTEITEEQISEKMQAGLTREQALEVLTAQRDHDATLTE